MNAHIHAENMRLYAEDATKTDKPWELWEFISSGVEDWQTLNSNPTWVFATEYRRKVKEADPRGADTRDAERLAWLCDSGNIYWITVQLEPSGDELFDDSPCRRDLRAAIDAAIAAAKEMK